MSVKDKESKTFEKLKQFFRVTKGSTVNCKGQAEFLLSSDLERDVCVDSPIYHRIKTLKELSEVVLTNRLEEHTIEKLWVLVKDLLHADVEKEHRHVALFFFKCLVQGQYDRLGIMRLHFFRVIVTHNLAEDVPPLLELLQSLTENGKDILHLEDKFCDFLVSWMSAISGADRNAEYLSLLVNVIKYNAAYVDEYTIMRVIDYSCFLCCWCNVQAVVLTCLQVLDTIVCYSNLPPDGLHNFIQSLCRKVNDHQYSSQCWKIMKNLLGTHMGHSTLYTMCRLLQDPANSTECGLLRGAIFFINMALWSHKRVPSLKCTPSSVLPSILQAMDCNYTAVIYEVILTIHRLVEKHGQELQDPGWDVVLSILEVVTRHVEKKDMESVGPVVDKLHETLCIIEKMIELGQFNGSVPKVFTLIEMSSSVRPETSVLRLITFIASSIDPTKHEWLKKLNCLLEKYFKQDTRPNIRVKAIEVLSTVVLANRMIYEEELMERIVIPHLQHVAAEQELSVRNAVAQLLVTLCLECESKKCLELLAILEKILNRPYEQHGPEVASPTCEGDILDLKTAAAGLIRIFSVKMYQLPSSVAIKAFKTLLTHLELHYTHHAVLDFNHPVHYMIFECLLKLRVNQVGHVGLAESTTAPVRYSAYLTIEARGGTGGGTVSPPPSSPAPSAYSGAIVTPLPLSSASKIMITALWSGKDWRILSLLLQMLPVVMQNKALILNKYGSDVGLLADALCALVTDKSLNLPECLRNLPHKMNRTEFHSHVFPVIAAISSYHTHLEPSQQQRCIKCLEVGLASRCARNCVMALTTCTLEMRDAMYKLLPEVLLNLSKISATVVIAIPILEFLSTLTSLPKVFASFVGDQYMSVFAIALPYTNPFKYNHYTVSLAHHVIAVWFLKCRLPFRRDFVKFITTGLKANVIVPFEEGQMMKSSDLSSLNEDSTSRKRSSSLTEQGSRRRERPPLNSARLGADLRPPIDDALMNFHMELTETCIDLMAKYTFSSCSARPKRLGTAEFLLSRGQAQTWLLGHKLITVTTSGCLQKPIKNNLCDRCWVMCRAEKELPTSPDREAAETDDAEEEATRLSRQSSGEGGAAVQSPTEAAKLEKILLSAEQEEAKFNKDTCTCWCQGWAEIHIRRPTGDMSWVLRIQNETNYQRWPLDLPMSDVATLFLPSQANQKDPRPASPVEPAQAPEDTVQQNRQHSGILSISTGPTSAVPIPGSPSKGPPSRQSSKESMDEVCYEEERSEEADQPGDALRKCESNRSLNTEEGMPQTYKRDRSRTISVMSPVRKSRYDLESSSTRNKDAPRSGICPSFVFLQLYHSSHFGSTEEKPILITQNLVIQRAILALDMIPPFETHKLGVIYVGPGQTNSETEILRNEFGSLRYTQFLHSLGTLINLKEADPQSTFLGGLDKSGVDGKFAYIWQDDLTQVTFHVATLMPTKESDPNCNAKKAHIGNDFVTIVYNESGEEYNMQTVRGQFNYANVMIQPLDHATNRVVVKVRDELADHICHGEHKIVSDQNLPILARQLALHANLASQVSRSIKAENQDPYASNWLERLRKMKRLRSKVLQLMNTGEAQHSHSEAGHTGYAGYTGHTGHSQHTPHSQHLQLSPKTKKTEYMDDFTEYT